MAECGVGGHIKTWGIKDTEDIPVLTGFPFLFSPLSFLPSHLRNYHPYAWKLLDSL